MTEDEAKTKWCPFTRVGGVESADNRPDGSYNCIGSACMGWRSVTLYSEQVLLPDGTISYPTSGHCGLAGKP